MQVKDRLTSIRPRIGDKSIARLGNALQIRDLHTGQQEMAQQPGCRAFQFIDRSDVTLGDDQRMNRCLGIDVLKRQGHIVFIENLGGNRPLYDATKQTITHRGFSLWFSPDEGRIFLGG
jgi:hypothetical protein